ncbi:hypothetical protein ASD36_15075 [Rhizobium sp. Root1334]|nr:hypothetical protein ASD36_15075 [Rhizobium sp. Root1334]
MTYVTHTPAAGQGDAKPAGSDKRKILLKLNLKLRYLSASVQLKMWYLPSSFGASLLALGISN